MMLMMNSDLRPEG